MCPLPYGVTGNCKFIFLNLHFLKTIFTLFLLTVKFFFRIHITDINIK